MFGLRARLLHPKHYQNVDEVGRGAAEGLLAHILEKEVVDASDKYQSQMKMWVLPPMPRSDIMDKHHFVAYDLTRQVFSDTLSQRFVVAVNLDVRMLCCVRCYCASAVLCPVLIRGVCPQVPSPQFVALLHARVQPILDSFLQVSRPINLCLAHVDGLSWTGFCALSKMIQLRYALY